MTLNPDSKLYLENKEFVDYLKLTTNGKTYYFCDDLTVEFDDCEYARRHR